MNDLDFNLLTGKDNNTSNDPISNTPSVKALGLVHYQAKLDTFIIRAFNLLSNNAIIDTNKLQSVTSSPITTNTTPNSVTYNDNESNNDNIPKPNESLTPNNNLDTNQVVNSPPISSKQQYMNIFNKISKIFSATLSSGVIDEKSTSPKSPIELYQRFQQILKEIELSYEASPYSNYFIAVSASNDPTKINSGLWRIKSDAELQDDQLWKFVSMCIFAVYDPQTGQLNNSALRNKKLNSLNNSPKESSISSNATSSIDTNANNVSTTNGIKKPKKRYVRRRNNTVSVARKKDVGANAGNNDNFVSTTSDNNAMSNAVGNNINMESQFTQLLQKRLQNVSQDIASRSLSGYYTQPTSPGFTSNGDPFNFNDLSNGTTSQQGMNNGAASNNRKRRSLGSIDVNTLDNDAMDEILQLSNPMDGAKALQNAGTEQIIDQLKQSYSSLLSEKDKRINQLERELELQRREMQWLRKLLIEDMGCVRSLLQDIRK
ncbi:hypothetical protein KAFR_0A07710 [Kazachstania africana CBS 2517]|uniref:Uncharacterized protein n=1 Tax=Kazachstania africana (strain ATCC 22294 / BCRC 22015 / CBS 2517 / CECT 1963 / NBRC 1671 / NRRL Y-8276) TaxID=1071382 RepID=H2APA5_KAZAF|nr:hypothetical protein KAFR_0A07710 [Kazachstania africana CBS 2517]CCF56205.1 hypothetical protein KAFR_0A07710 [Kazachstania africana CBS 2517]